MFVCLESFMLDKNTLKEANMELRLPAQDLNTAVVASLGVVFFHPPNEAAVTLESASLSILGHVW